MPKNVRCPKMSKLCELWCIYMWLTAIGGPWYAWLATETSRRVVGAMFDVHKNITKRMCVKLLNFTLNVYELKLLKFQ